ncbi:Flavin carrier protein 2 [Escovopsis weberi]|uniref:Flavin carrier protein 2 n=1 Tax=Escovopsis weberi TaxID=150374 RepID=A0A0N0RU39_ESCWE|nr:Flavin carrier protein 2 [Escovopsis weberi]
MRSFSRITAFLAAAASLLTPAAAAEKVLTSNSLNTCQDNSDFSASFFRLSYTPNNNTIMVDMFARSTVEGKVVFDVEAAAYGYTFLRQVLDPCTMGLQGLCPMVSGDVPMPFNIPVPADASSHIPGIAYNIPDLDASVTIRINLTETGQSIACVQANISNGKTVDLTAIKWATAAIAGLALVASAIVNGLGHSNTAAHIASNSLSLFGYFQSQAIIGLTGVHLPPIVRSWTQNFQWSMGIIYVNFMQIIFTWYQRATGGTAADIFDSILTTSVLVQKRSTDIATIGANAFSKSMARMPKAAALINPALAVVSRRGNISDGNGSFIVYGIQRVAFRAHIETTNLFMTGLTFFWLFGLLTLLCVALFKGVCELCARQQWIRHDQFLEFRNGWRTVLKGILFRVALIGFPQLSILCIWEFTQVDSPAEVVLAVFYLFCPLIALAWGASKVVLIARRSISSHGNPAVLLYSDPQMLNKWGFLYIQFRASAYYFIGPFLGYTLVKAMFIALAQKSGITQAVALMVIEAIALIAVSVLRPYMDKRTNSFNIAICVVNFLNAIFLFIFTNIFDAPGLAVGVVGVVLFVLNAILSLVLILTVLISTILSIFRKDPDARYQFMADDRASFMKSQTQLHSNMELDALAATARGEKSVFNIKADNDSDSTPTSIIAPQAMDSQQSFQPALGSSATLFPPSDSHMRSQTASPMSQLQRPSDRASPASFRTANNAR